MWQTSDSFRRWNEITSIESLKDGQDWSITPGHVKIGTSQLTAFQSAFSTGLADFSKGENAKRAISAADGVFKNAVGTQILILGFDWRGNE
jgi:hypothetical protein